MGKEEADLRIGEITRTTKETNIRLRWNLDGSGRYMGSCGVGFFDHMMQAFCVHGGFDMDLDMKGDLEVDCHHSIEDLGIVMGQAFSKALGDKGSIRRYGSFYISMDEALGFCSLDISGRPYLVFDAEFANQSVGTLDCCMVKEFFRAFAFNGGITLHLRCPYGENDHHKIEALFKAAAHALKEALEPNGGKILSSKGMLA